MSKRNKSKARKRTSHKLVKQSNVFQPSINSGFHITIGASPNADLDMRHELNMIKATLLYADSATLNSPKVVMYGGLAAMGELNLRQKVEFLNELMPALRPEKYEEISEPLKQLLLILSMPRRMAGREKIVAGLKQMINPVWDELNETLETMLVDAGGEGLVKALQSGAVFLEKLNPDMDQMVDEYFDRIFKAIEKGSTHLMLDVDTAGLVNAAISEGILVAHERSIQRGKHIQLATDLFNRLPLFECASIDEVLEIRKELFPYLSKYRSAIWDFSTEISSASWDKDFQFDADDTIRNKIEPVVQEIAETVRSNSFLSELLKQLTKVPSFASGSVIGLAVANADALPGLIGAAIGSVASAAAIGAPAVKRYFERKQEIERNSLYFYYGASQKLS